MAIDNKPRYYRYGVIEEVIFKWGMEEGVGMVPVGEQYEEDSPGREGGFQMWWSECW
jgi:hypothetical protein